jgi:hypothetical protein
MTQTISTAELDEHLQQVVQALHRTVGYAIPHAKEPEIAARALRDCEEILAVVMEGDVSEWLG